MKFTVPDVTISEAVPAGQLAEYVEQESVEVPVHNCDENAVPYVSDGALGHGWECGLCGRFLQAG